jgi:hypothetical protein
VKKLAERIEKLPRQAVWGVALIIVIYCTINPPIVPIPFSNRSLNMYNVINAIPDGSKILVDDESSLQLFRVTDQYPCLVAVLNHLATKNCRFVFFSSMLPDNSQMFDSMIISSHDFIIGTLPGKVYGIDWAILGWVGGMESGLSSFGNDILASKPYDYQGLSTKDMPIFTGIKNAGDFNFLIMTAAGSDTPAVFRQIQSPYKLPAVMVAGSGSASEFMAYVSSGNLKEVLYGVQMGAEYETLIKKHGVGLATVGSQNITVIYELVLIIGVSNIPTIAGLIKKSSKKTGSIEKTKGAK